MRWRRKRGYCGSEEEEGGGGGEGGRGGGGSREVLLSIETELCLKLGRVGRVMDCYFDPMIG